VGVGGVFSSSSFGGLVGDGWWGWGARARKGKCTLWKAAQLADVPLRDMMEMVEENKVPLHISPEDVDEAWREALEG